MKSLNEDTASILQKRIEELQQIYANSMDDWLLSIGVESTYMEHLTGSEGSPKATLALLVNNYFHESNISYVEFLQSPNVDPDFKEVVQSCLEVAFCFGFFYAMEREV